MMQFVYSIDMFAVFNAFRLFVANVNPQKRVGRLGADSNLSKDARHQKQLHKKYFQDCKAGSKTFRLLGARPD